MANSVSVLNQQKYTKTVQALLQESLIAMDLANVDLRASFGNGTTINYPRPQYNNVSQYTKYTAQTVSDVEYTNETMTVDNIPQITFQYDPVDEIENAYDVLGEQAKDNAFRIRQYIEGKFFEAAVSSYTTPAAVAVSAVATDANFGVTIYGAAVAELQNAGVNDKELVTVVDPYTLQVIGRGALGNTFQVADETYKRGFKGEYCNTMLYMTPNLTGTAILNVATNPSADNTVTIAGVTWTFKATPAAAGEIDIGASAAASLTLLAAAINNTNGYAAGAGSATAYFEVSTANRAKLAGISAVVVGTTLVLTSIRGYKPVSQTLTDAADVWGAFSVKTIVMQKKSINLVMQKSVSLAIREGTGLAMKYTTWGKFGVKTFTEGAERIRFVPVILQAAGA
jgi:hypothetical protein